MSGLRGNNVPKRARLSEDLFASDRALDVCGSALISQPSLDVSNDIPAKWVHRACKPDCDEDADGYGPNNDSPCVCRFKYFWIIGKVNAQYYI